MKEITKKYLRDEIKEMEELNSIMNDAAAHNPFGPSINLKEEALEQFSGLEDRIRVQVWQSHRIIVLNSLLKELK